eukprot:2462312-Pleurochrysis_carterae.AAC.1
MDRSTDEDWPDSISRDQNRPDAKFLGLLLDGALDGNENTLESDQDELSAQQGCNCKVGHSAWNQEEVAAMPCNLVRMLQVGRGAMPACDLNESCCNDAVPTRLAQGH